MDYLTQCYYSRMRPYRDRPDISVAGRWHWCEPGAKVIPYLHLFGSHTMDPGEERINPTVGEIPQKNGRSRGQNNPRMNGTGFCGTEQDWTEGALYGDPHVPPAVDADGFPLCCPQSPMQGGIELDGSADQGVAMSGGVEAGGEGSSAFSHSEFAEGGSELGGTSPPPPREIHAEGGITCDGESPPTPREDTVEPSDLVIGGEGSQPTYRDIDPEGGGEFGGEGDKPVRRLIVAEGGLETGGEGDKPVGRPIHPEGGLETGGEGDSPLSTDIHAEGGVEVDGREGILTTAIHPEGGLEIGSADQQAQTNIPQTCSLQNIPDRLVVDFHWESGFVHDTTPTEL